MFVFVLVCITLCPFQFCNHLEEKKRAALLLLSYGFLVTENVPWSFIALPRMDLHCVIVVTPDHTQLLFRYSVS